MTTAIVTITCPSCGGRVEGIRATDDDQTVKCTFCGTDLHIPRIGAVVHERVVREVVHEVESAPVYATNGDMNDAGLLRPKRNPVPGAIVATVLLSTLGIFMCVQNEQAKDDMKQFDQDQASEKAAHDACEARCKAQCANAGDKESGQWDTAQYALEHSPNLEQQMKDTDVLVCTTDCEMKADCLGLNRGH